MTALVGPADAKYVTVRAELARTVASMTAGQPLPAERDLAASLGVARMTLRRALDALAAEGAVIRRRGQGTFVAPATGPHRLSASSFSQDMRERGLRPGSRTLDARVGPAGLVVAACLEVPPNTPTLHVRRLRLADDAPMAIEDLHVPSDLVPGLEGADLDGASFYDLLDRRYGLRIARGTQTVEPALALPADAAAMTVPVGAPCFLFERVSRVGSGRVIEFVRSVYRGDRYRIMVDIFPPSRPAP